MRIASVTALLFQFALAVNAAALGDGEILVLKADARIRVSPGADLKVSFSITNTGPETYRILNTPNSLLATTSFDTNKFYPERKDNKNKPAFKGIELSWDAEGAAKDGDFTELRPGATLSVTHNLKSVYDFSKSGPGVYTLAPAPFVQLVGSAGAMQLARLDPAPQTEITVSRQLWQTLVQNERTVQTASRPGNYSATMYDISNCPQDDVVTAAAQAANTLLGLAQNNVVANQIENTWNMRQPKTWFGRWSQQRALDVISSLVAIDTFDNYKYDCTCSRGSPQTYAYVIRSQDPDLINLCPKFFSSLTNGYSLWKLKPAGTLIHE
ncbi:hypothetical protein FRC10_010584 [Ceratobasidium sp. 414]|nr:hypothetical protein FRC10_010584 [Ceratobasidium sp. 414]